MIFRQLFDQNSSTYTYLLASGQGREGLIIDPVLEHTDRIIQWVNELGLKLAITLDTHVHADHITASGKLREKTACQIAMGDQTQAEALDIRIKDGEMIDVDGIKLKGLYTPGHTDDSFCFLMNDRVFTGDTLLIRRTGRTDFQNGSASDLYHSLHDILMKLPEETLVYPAHDYAGMTVSTIGEEKHFNPRLQVNTEGTFVELMNNLNLPYPKMFDLAVPANLRCGVLS
jgi:glyoxylase-like metal-dependent hydrolase (beta-lactamase superfamily II)